METQLLKMARLLKIDTKDVVVVILNGNEKREKRGDYSLKKYPINLCYINIKNKEYKRRNENENKIFYTDGR